MKIKKEKLIFMILSMINVLVFTLVIKDYYTIIDFTFKDILVNIFIASFIYLGIYKIIKGKKKKEKVLGFIITLISFIICYLIFKNYSVDLFVSNVDKINLEISKGSKLYYSMFKDIFILISFTLTLLSVVTIYIFPFNIIILDSSLLMFLEIVDFNTINTSYIFCFASIIVVSIVLYRNKSNILEKNINYDNNFRSSLQVLLVSILILISFKFIDINEEGVYMNKIQSYLSNNVSKNKYISNEDLKDQFSLKQTGYSDSESNLGGDIELDNKIALRIDKGESKNIPSYLRGTVKYKYKGDSWEKYKPSIEDKKEIKSEDYNDLNEIIISPEYEFTSALFSSLNTKDINLINSKNKILKDRNSNLYFLKNKSDSDYKIFFDNKDDKESILDKSSKKENIVNRDEFITDRTVKFAKELVDENLSDREKAEIITKYLKSNYQYSLKPGNLDKGKDFVEEFLFEDKKGYCVHFASSLTVLLNSLDIEARYVEGFKMSDELIDGKYIVRNSDAHAWTEVLVDKENNKWEIFDSTSTMREYDQLIQDSEPENKDQEGNENNIKDKNKIKDKSKIKDENIIKDENSNSNLNSTESENSNPETEDTTESKSEESISRVKNNESIFMKLRESLKKKASIRDYIIITFTFIIILLYLNYRYRKVSLDFILKSDNFDLKFLILITMIQNLYGEKMGNETFYDYKNKIKNKNIKNEYEKIIENYYLKKYSKEKIKNNNYKELYSLLINEYRENGKYYLYILNKYIRIYGFTKYI